jgi:OOP family OmpA-OmpF porin
MARAPMKRGFKLFLFAAGLGITGFSAKSAMQHGLIPTPGIMKAIVPQKAVLPDVKEAQVENVTPVPLPTDTPANVEATLIRGEIWEWNAQAGLIYANGGATTAKGSLMEKQGVNLLLSRQDDTSQMQKDIIACAKELKGGAQQCSSGANFVVIMGDGSGQFAAAVNSQLVKLGPEWQVKVIGATGYSRGEDGYWGSSEIKRNPEAAKGTVVAGVVKDGDWNIAQKFFGDNNIRNNPTFTTYDPDAVNWANADDYLKAAEMYNSGYCDDRVVVRDGKPTGEKKHVCVNGVVTWTPGDVNIAKNKGGLVRIVSSKQYRSQMPATIIGPGRFFQQNRPEVEGMLAAVFQAGDQLKAFDQALHKAAAISAKLYNDQDEAYWYKYFKGTTERDSTGTTVELGGSAVNNLADNHILFGMDRGTNDNFRSTYTVFSQIAQQQYPNDFKEQKIPEAKDIEDKSYISGAEAHLTDTGAEADTQTFASNTGTEHAVSHRSYYINFETGKANLTSDGVQTVAELKDQIAITGLKVKIDGYTDNSGDEVRTNVPLSQARATAVKQWLQTKAPRDFPNGRFKVAGHGSQNPVAPNTTVQGKAANRRVEITLLEIN